MASPFPQAQDAQNVGAIQLPEIMQTRSISDGQGGRKQYVDLVKAFSIRSKELFFACGEHYKAFAQFLETASRNTQISAITGAQTPVVCVHINNPAQTKTEVILFDAVTGHKLFQNLPQADSQTSQIIFLRGWQSSEWLRVLGGQCGIDPECFRRHLDFVRYTEFHDLPPLPSTTFNIWRLRITTICHRQADGPNDIERSRESDLEVVEKHQRDLRAKGIIGSSIVRRYAVHDETVSTIEQDISIAVRQKKKGGWIGLVWLDSGKPLDESDWAPWREHGSTHRKVHQSSHLPVIQHKPKAAFQDDDMDKYVQINRQSSPSERLNSEKPLQSACLLPFQYGASLNRDLMRVDALYAFSDLFAFAACSENQFINFVEKQVAGAVRAFRGQEEWSIATLKYSKDLLEEHLQHLQSTILCLENEARANMPRAKEPADCEARNAVLELLQEDFKYLELRTKVVAARAKEGTKTIMNDILLKDSRQGISQAREVGRLSVLAYFFLPMSFVTSVFGMNSVEIKDWRWSFGAILIVFFVVMSISLILGFWESMPWKSRRLRARRPY